MIWLGSRGLVSLYIVMNPVLDEDLVTVGELVRLKNITVGSNSPLFMVKAAFHSCPFFIFTALYPHLISSFVKRVHPLRWSIC